MKCPHCGAEIGSSKVCDYCGSRISYDMQLEQEKLNRKGCPKCGSTNIRFTRETREEIRGKKTRQVVNETVGICNDCGFTWIPDVDESVRPAKRRTWLWVLGWIFIFPVPLTILLMRKKDMHPALRYAIIAAAWIVFCILFLMGNKDRNKSSNQPGNSGTVIEEPVDEPGSSAEPQEPSEPETPPEPETPAEPETPSEPEGPDEPEGPEEPGQPEGPGDPSDPRVDADGDGISDNLKAFLDSFEAFVDSYLDFLKNYDESDASQAAEYTRLFESFNDFMEKSLAWDSYDMNAEERQYYMTVMARITGKLIEIAVLLD